jgi:FAD/FMN-containing dehydrogenase
MSIAETPIRANTEAPTVDEIATLARQLEGQVILPDAPDYLAARRLHGLSTARPAVIVRPASAADVAATITFAREHQMELAVRSGGHSLAHYSVVEGGVVLDLSLMKAISIDTEHGIARLEAGLTWGEVAAALHPHGLGLTAGDTASVGVGGLTLGGGIGWFARKYGLTIDHVRSIEVVTADGQIITASATEHPDLFWALRGGGGNFGVVTSFEYALHDVGPTVFAGAVFYSGDDAAEILDGYRKVSVAAPDALSTVVNLTTAPPVPFLPESVHGKPIVAILGMWSGPLAEGDGHTRGLRELAPPIADLFGPMPYVAMQSLIDPLYPRGIHNYFRSAFMPTLDATSVESMLRSYGTLPNPLTELHIHHLGGAVSRIPSDATAFGTRDAEFILNVVARTTDANGFGSVVDWARAVTDGLGADARAYVNYTGEASVDRVRASYPEGTYDRLVTVKDRYDPTNLFRLNQNIKPSQP